MTLPLLNASGLGKRFGASARTQMIDDMKSCGVETAAYSHPLHQQFFYMNTGATVGWIL